LLIIAAVSSAAQLSFAQERLAQGAAGRIDKTLYTTYNLGALVQVNWVVCGSTQNTAGCYGAGSLFPFGRIGALLEGEPQTDLTTNTVTRAIYVLDVASGSSKDGVVLSVYTKTDQITPDFDFVNVTFDRTISLPLLGGLSAKASMGANEKFLFLGTDQSPFGIELNKRDFTFSQVGVFFPPINVTDVTVDNYGYVTMTFGPFFSGPSGFIVFEPNGSQTSEGGGANFMLGTRQAVLPPNLP